MNYYKKLDDTKTQCLLCEHKCIINNNKSGICKVNKNINGKIKCLVYGYPSAIHIDPIEKKPLYHFLPNTKTFSIGTVSCNFKCNFCQNWRLSRNHIFDKNKFFSPKEIVNLAIKNNCNSISFTYNEPTIFYPYAKDIAIIAKEKGLKTIYVSNGFQSEETIKDMKNIIDAFNIDLKSFNDQYYKKILGGKLDVVLRNLKLIHNLNMHLEITTLIIPTINDNKKEINSIINFIKTLDINTPWHISAFHPDYKELDLPKTPIDTLDKIFNFAKEQGLNYVYKGNTSDINKTICPNCGKTLITRKSYITTNVLKNNFCPYCNNKIQGVFK